MLIFEYDQMEKEDILSRFLEASKKDPEQMNDEYVKDITLNFMLAGKDTTANAITWFICCLCKNLIVQEKIVQEVKQVMFNSGDDDDTTFDVDTFVDRLTNETIEKMHYLHAALSETLRLYSAVPVVINFTPIHSSSICQIVCCSPSRSSTLLWYSIIRMEGQQWWMTYFQTDTE